MFLIKKQNGLLFLTLFLFFACKEPVVNTDKHSIQKIASQTINFKPKSNISLAQAPQTCQNEVMKTQPLLEKFQSACFLVGEEKEKKKDYGTASWYYVLAKQYSYNVEVLSQKKLQDDNIAFYANMAHSFVLNETVEKAQEYYRYFLLNSEEEGVDEVMNEDFSLMEKLYPEKKIALQRGRAVWKRVWTTKLKIDQLYRAYLEFERRREFKKTIPLLNQLISLDKNSVKYASYRDYYRGVKAHHQEQYQKSIEFLEKANKNYLFKDVASIPYIYILAWLSEDYMELRKYDQAFKYRHQLTQKMIKSFGEKHPYVALSYDFTALIYERKEEHSKALEYYKKSLAIKENAQPRNELEITASLSHISGVYYSMGEYAKSLTLLQKVLTFNEKNLEPFDAELATNYNNMGTYYGKLGSDEKALTYYKKALKIRQKTLGENHKDTALLYSEMGTSYQNLKAYRKALDSFEHSIEIYKKNYGEKSEEVSSVYQALGELYSVMKKPTLAIEYIKRSLAIRENLKDSEGLLLADNYRSLASAYLYNHQTALGIKYLEKDLALKRKLFGEENRLVQETKIYISSLKGDYDDSYASSKKVFEKSLEERERYFAILDNADKESYIKKSKESIYHLLGVTTHAQSNKLEKIQDTFTAWLRYKGAMFDEENSIHLLYENTKDVQVKTDIDAFLSKKRALANLYQNGATAKRREIIQLEEEINKISNTLSQKSHVLQELKALKSLDYKDVAEVLQSHQLYIDYAYVGGYYFIFTLNAKAEVHLEQLSKYDSNAINRAVLSFRKKVKRNKEAKAELSMLYNLLLKERVDSSKKLTISSDGLLRILPFEALYDVSKKAYLIESKEISYISSGKELLRLGKYRDTQRSNDKIVIFANPNFNAELPATSRAVNGRIVKAFSQLQGTKEEASAIKQILSGKHIVAYEEERANEAHLLNIDAPKILHIATHGFFTKRKQPNPMLNSGIALSGANRAISSGQGEGIVTALKLSGLHLKNTELVVLSACETGLMSSDSTESLSSLNKAFIEAGARNVVISLWSVSDKGTKALMENFYREMQIHKSYSKALQEAKLKMIRQEAPPFIWAPFIINGE